MLSCFTPTLSNKVKFDGQNKYFNKTTAIVSIVFFLPVVVQMYWWFYRFGQVEENHSEILSVNASDAGIMMRVNMVDLTQDLEKDYVSMIDFNVLLVDFKNKSKLPIINEHDEWTHCDC